jgi:hypothetical protein
MEIIGQSANSKNRDKKIIKHAIIGIYMAGQHIAETGPKMNNS